MRKVWTILGIAGGIVLLVLVAVAIAVWTVDVNQFVAPVQRKVKEATGRDLAIGGRVALSLGLEPKIVLDDVRLSNAPWAKEKDFAAVKRLEAQVALLPLLSRRFEVVRLNLVEPAISLEVAKDGKVNWDFGAGTPGTPGAAGGGPAAALAAFGIGQLEIEKGSVTYRDDATGSVRQIAVDRFAAQARSASSPINAEFRGAVDGVPIALTGNLGPVDALIARRSPYAISIEGKVADKPANVKTNLNFAQDAVQADDLAVGLGVTKATGQAVVASGAPRKVTLRLSSPLVSLADLQLPLGGAVPASKAATAEPGKKGWIFSDEHISFAGLAGADVDGDVSIAELRLDDRRKLSDVHARFTLRGAVLDMPLVQAKAMGGTVQGSLSVDATHPTEPTLRVAAQAKGLDLAALLAAGGSPRQVKGGETDVTLDLATRGTSEREWARNASGSVLAVVGPASVVNSKETDSGIGKIAEAVNPFRGRQAVTEIKCVVVRLPLKDGVASVDHSIAAETREIGVLATGTIDLRNETLDLDVSPRTRVTLPVDLPRLASLVRVHGALASPSVGIDVKAATATIAQLGAAAAKGGGLAALGVLAAPTGAGEAGGAEPCQVALGRAPAPAAAPPPASPSAAPAGTPRPEQDLQKALKGLLGR